MACLNYRQGVLLVLWLRLLEADALLNEHLHHYYM